MSHPSEEQLAHFANEPSFDEREQLQAHIETCAKCGGAVENYGELISTLSSEETWASRESERSSSVASIVKFDVKWSTEKAEAAALMNRLKDVDPAEWPLDEFHRTPGMVLEMLKRWRSEVVRSPLRSLEIVEAAERVAGLIPSLYSTDIILQVRGGISKHKSIALRLLGRFGEAHADLDRAESLFAQLAIPDFDLATVEFNRAQVFSETDEYDKGLKSIDSAVSVFQRLGVASRVAACRMIRGGLLYYKGQVPAAQDEFSLALHSGDLDEATVPGAILNSACCSLLLEDFEQAIAGSSHAFQLFSEQGNRVEALRALWALGRCQLAIGLEEDGLSTLRSIVSEYRDLEMFSDAALVVLDLVEHLLGRGVYEEASGLCSSALDQFVVAGMPAAAARAMAHLRDVTARGEANAADVGDVRALIAERTDGPRFLSM